MAFFLHEPDPWKKLPDAAPIAAKRLCHSVILSNNIVAKAFARTPVSDAGANKSMLMILITVRTSAVLSVAGSNGIRIIGRSIVLRTQITHNAIVSSSVFASDNDD
jgi:hypothetical protein